MIVNDNGPTADQIGYVDGYSIGDRLLEGVRFKIEVIDGQPICTGVHPDDAIYMEQFSDKKMTIWQCEAQRMVEHHGMEMQTEDGSEDLYWEPADRAEREVREPIEIKALGGDDFLKALKGL